MNMGLGSSSHNHKIGRGWIFNTEAHFCFVAFVAHLSVQVCDVNSVPSIAKVVAVVNVEPVS